MDREQSWFLLIIATFVSGLILLLPYSGRYHGDERFYSDGALVMLQDHEFFYPKYIDGTMRLEKPPLFYWAEVISFVLFGKSLWASRLPSLLVAIITIFITLKLQLIAFPSLGQRPISTYIIASNFTFLAIATRGTPDSMTLCFITLAIFGFLKALLYDSSPGCMIGYIACGLALTTKGLIGLLPILWYLSISLFTKKRVNTLDYLGVLFTTLICGLWMYFILSQFGKDGFEPFWRDQISSKINITLWMIPVRFCWYLLDILKMFLPWTAIVLLLSIRKKDEFIHEISKSLPLIYLVIWILLVVMIFSLGGVIRGRYMIYTYPPIALIMARALSIQSAWFSEKIVKMFRLVSWVFVVIGILCVMLFSLTFKEWCYGCVILISVILIGLYLVKRREVFRVWYMIGIASIVVYVTGELFFRKALIADPVPVVSKFLKSGVLKDCKETALIGLDSHFASLLRIYTGGTIWPKPYSHYSENGTLPSVILTDNPIIVENFQLLGWVAYKLTPYQLDTKFESTLLLNNFRFLHVTPKSWVYCIFPPKTD